MRRRQYLGLAAGGVLGGLAGCSDRSSEGRSTVTPAPGSVSSGGTADLDLPVPRSEMRRGAAMDAIPAITDPVFGTDWSGVTVRTRQVGERTEFEPRLRSDDMVVGVVRGETRGPTRSGS